ncbi:MAG: hypothetical protein EP329_16800 [Deltaproteobacteria bacterium]|nr:MAG: hypothetical protein EP329_16800 [Deltaproteobacteria bacterium]
MIATRNDSILQQLSPFVVTTRANRAILDEAPFGLATRWFVDPHMTRWATFFDLLQRLDALTFGPEGMPMDKWVFYNCAELPGFIYGFALEADALSASERDLMGVPAGWSGPVPFSMYIAIPMHEPGSWFGHNLCSLNRTFPQRGFDGLGTITKAIALAAFKVERFYGATQWLSKALHIHTRFGPLDLYTAYTPAHSMAETLTYGFEVTTEKLRYAAGDPAATMRYPEPDITLDARDVPAMQDLQRRIEAGERFVLAGAPSTRGVQVVHPITTVAAGA